MKHLLLSAALLLAGCATTKPRQEMGPAATPAAYAPAPDSAGPAAVVQPPRTVLDKVLHRPARPAYVAAPGARIGKKSTVSYYYGPATVTTAGKGAAIGDGAVAAKKPAAPLATGGSTAQATGGGALASGTGAQASGGATVKQAPGWLATLLGPTGYVVGGALVLGLLVFLIRRKAANVMV